MKTELSWKCEAVIFDMDGVIIDSEPVYFEIEQQLYHSLGLQISWREHSDFVGMSMRGIWQYLKNKYNLQPEVSTLVAEHKKMMLKAFSQYDHLDPISGFVSFFNDLETAGIKTALASSSMRSLIDIVLDKIQLTGRFSVIVSGDDVVNGKPAPDIFLKTAHLLDSPADRCMVIEDSSNGIRAAKAAGMFCLGLRNHNSGYQDLSQADAVIDYFSQVEACSYQQIVIKEGR